MNRLRYLFPAPNENMPRRKKEEKVQLGTYLPVDLYSQLQSFRDDSGIPITRIVEDAIREYLTRRHALDQKSGDKRRDEA